MGNMPGANTTENASVGTPTTDVDPTPTAETNDLGELPLLYNVVEPTPWVADNRVLAPANDMAGMHTAVDGLVDDVANLDGAVDSLTTDVASLDVAVDLLTTDVASL